ncbi:MAG: HPr family phosphocarrier protein [Gammaproteobacteria bacterium]|nr:HPr family phosphocarrier protein [Gammaproteobacteria bacterium]NNJ91542.1 HPr family phosphocarrier protein [Gammaproteobacteria bacterium]
MLEQEIEIVNKLGLHARAAAKLVSTAGQFTSEVLLSKGHQEINAKSIMGVMMLAASIGSVLNLKTSGTDERQAMDALVELINDKFGEGE